MFRPVPTTIAVLLSCFLMTMDAVTALAQLPPATGEATFTAAGRKPLGGAQIAQKLAGNTTYTVNLDAYQGGPRGTVTPTFWRDRQRATMVLPPAGTKVDASWWIEADRLCMKFSIKSEVTGCSRLYEVDGTLYSCAQSNSQCIFMLRVVPGNAEKL